MDREQAELFDRVRTEFAAGARTAFGDRLCALYTRPPYCVDGVLAVEFVVVLDEVTSLLRELEYLAPVTTTIHFAYPVVLTRTVVPVKDWRERIAGRGIDPNSLAAA
jgi:hypothetical protein